MPRYVPLSTSCATLRTSFNLLYAPPPYPLGIEVQLQEALKDAFVHYVEGPGSDGEKKRGMIIRTFLSKGFGFLGLGQ